MVASFFPPNVGQGASLEARAGLVGVVDTYTLSLNGNESAFGVCNITEHISQNHWFYGCIYIYIHI